MPSAMKLRIPVGVRRDDGVIECFADDAGNGLYLSMEDLDSADQRPAGDPVLRIRVDREVTRGSVLAGLGVEV